MVRFRMMVIVVFSVVEVEMLSVKGLVKGFFRMVCILVLVRVSVVLISSVIMVMGRCMF